MSAAVISSLATPAIPRGRQQRVVCQHCGSKLVPLHRHHGGVGTVVHQLVRHQQLAVGHVARRRGAQ